MRFYKKTLAVVGILVLTFVIGAFLVADVVHAQGFGTGYLSGAELPTEDIRVLIIRIINISLGIIGTIFLLFIIYAGFLWMTARGNPQQVEKAKKIMINAVTGLVIIIMSFGITTLVFNLLEGSSNNGGGGPISCTDGQVSGCSVCVGGVWNYDPSICPLPGSEFKIRDIATAHGGSDDSQDVFLCSSIQANTNNTIDQATIPGNVTLTAGGTSVPATLAITSRAIEVIPSTQLAPNTTFTARYNTALTDQSGLHLSACDPFGCTLNGTEYTWDFTTGTTVDQSTPTIVSSNPIFDTSSALYPDRNVDRDELIRVTFSEAIRATTVDDGTGSPISANIIVEEMQAQGVSYSPARILDSSMFDIVVRSNGFDLVLRAPELFSPFNWYQITVQNVEDLCGNQMTPTTWEFQTNDNAPGIGGFYPTSSNVCPDVGVVTVSFGTSMYYDTVDIVIDNGITPISAAINPSLLEPGPYQVTGSDGGTWSVDPASNFRVFTYTFNGSLNTGPYTVAVNTDRVIDGDGNVLSDGWGFNVGDPASCTCSPYISSITPNQGFLGQCVTIRGQCFNGAAPNNPSDPRYATVSGLTFNLGGSQVAATIGSQASNYIVTTIPNGFALDDRPLPQMTITYNDSVLGSLTTNNTNVDYFVSSAQQAQGPCLLSINPAQACTDATVRLNGLRFGSDPGVGSRSTASNNVTYNDGSIQVPDSQVTSWSDSTINTRVPAGTADGNIQITSSGLVSNAVPFDLACGVGSSCSDVNGMCSNAQCASGLSCNTSTCLCESNSSPNGPIVTAKGPTCSQSCTNVGIWADFSEAMNASTISESTIDVLPCGVDCNLGGLGSEIGYANISYDSALQRVSISPAGALSGNTSYRVILRSAISGESGEALSGLNFDTDGDGTDDAYSWTFATKNGECAITGVQISPLTATASDLGQTVGFTAYPQGSDQQCGNQTINGYTYDWGWSSSVAGVATISTNDNNGDGLVDPTQRATAVAEGTTNITASQSGFSASGVLNVNVITCDETTDCTNGGQCPGSVCDLSIERCTPVISSLSPASGPVGRWSTVQGCYFGSSQGTGQVRFGGTSATFPACGGGVWQDQQIIIEVPDDGSTGAHDVAVYASNGLVSNLVSFNVTNDCSGVAVPAGGIPGICSVSPASGAINSNVNIAGARFSDNSDPQPDIVTFANSSGGRTQATTNSWTNGSISARVPTDGASGDVIVEVNSCPSNAVNFDVSAGPGTGCSNNTNSCSPNNSKCGSGTGLYCEPTSCTCQFAPAPSVVGAIPSGANICLNAAVEITFDQLMDVSSVRSNTRLNANYLNAQCNELSRVDLPDNLIGRLLSSVDRLVESFKIALFGTPTSAQSGCIVPASISTYYIDANGDGVLNTLDDQTVAIVKPNRKMEQNTQYWVQVSTGAKNLLGTPLSSGYMQPSFTTGNDLCQIASVDITVTPPGAKKTIDTFYCAGQDGCLNDQDPGTGGNQHRWFAQAYDISKIPLVADYNWSEVDTQNAFSLSSTNVNDVMVTPEPVNGARASFSVGAHDSSGVNIGRATSTIVVSSHICENPWPARPNTPFTDSQTDFSIWYCRDRGSSSDTSDDLPALTVVEAAGSGSSEAALIPTIKQFLFLLPAPSSDAIALRVHSNTEFLSPIEWYRRFVPNQGSPSSVEVDGYQAIRDGRTIYVSSAQSGSGYSANIYLISYNANADSDTVKIYDEMLKNWHFTLNLLDLNACELDLTIACSSDATCEDAGAGSCLIPATKVRRDLKRITDLGGILSLLKRYRGICSTDQDRGCAANSDCPGGQCLIQNPSYPVLSAGTYITGRSTSRWPSWSGALANALGVGSLPQDPFNSFNGCPDGYDPNSCWDAANGQFVCPDGSHVYQYVASGNGSSFNLYANLELDTISWSGFGGGGGASCTGFSIGP